jgi:hypothetical protein
MSPPPTRRPRVLHRPRIGNVLAHESGLAVAHRAVIERAKALAELATKIEEAGAVSAGDVETWRPETRHVRIEYDRFAVGIGSLVGFRLPGTGFRPGPDDGGHWLSSRP